MVEEKQTKKKTAKKETEASQQAQAPQTEKRETPNTERAKASGGCADKKCAMHGNITTRGRMFEGSVVSDKMQGTVTVEWPRQSYLPKFERYEKRRSRVKAHNPPCIAAKAGERVRIAECRPLAKTVKFVVIEKIMSTR